MNRRIVVLATLSALVAFAVTGLSFYPKPAAAKPPATRQPKRQLITVVPVYTPASYAVIPQPGMFAKRISKKNPTYNPRRPMDGPPLIIGVVQAVFHITPSTLASAGTCTEMATTEKKITAYLIDANTNKIVETQCKTDSDTPGSITFQFLVDSQHYIIRLNNAHLGYSTYKVHGRKPGDANDTDYSYAGVETSFVQPPPPLRR